MLDPRTLAFADYQGNHQLIRRRTDIATSGSEHLHQQLNHDPELRELPDEERRCAPGLNRVQIEDRVESARAEVHPELRPSRGRRASREGEEQRQDEEARDVLDVVEVRALGPQRVGRFLARGMAKTAAAPPVDSATDGGLLRGRCQPAMTRLSLIVSVLDSHEVVRRQLLHLNRVLTSECELLVMDDGSEPSLEATCAAVERAYAFRLVLTHALPRRPGVRGLVAAARFFVGF